MLTEAALVTLIRSILDESPLITSSSRTITATRLARAVLAAVVDDLLAGPVLTKKETP